MAKGKSAKQQAKEIEMLERAIRVVELRKSGASLRAIANKLKSEGLDVTYKTVERDLDAALKVLAESRLNKTKEMRELQNERLEGLLLAHYPAAIGRIEVLKNPFGEPIIDPESNKPELKIHAPNIAEGYLALNIINSISDLFSLRVQKHEITGADGKPLDSGAFPATLADWRKDVQKRRAEVQKTEQLFQDQTQAPPS